MSLPSRFISWSEDRVFWFILISLMVITLLHYLTDVQLLPYHSIYRSLYYIPIAVAAVRYGRVGGILAALTTSALYIPHVFIAWGVVPDESFNDLLENALFLFVGILAGTLADAERQQRQRAEVAAQQLAQQAEVAERMRAETESILESIDSGVITIDTDGQVMQATRAAQHLLNSADGVHAPLHTQLQVYMTHPASDYQQHTIAGRTLGLHRTPLVGARSEQRGHVLVLDNLTALKSLEEQVQHTERHAALGRLAGGLAHEIRNPLAITRAAAQMLQQRLVDTPKLHEYTAVMQTEIDRMDQLIEQLLTYARPQRIAHCAIDVDALVTRTMTLTQAYAAQHAVRMISDVSPDTPSLEGDPELLHQALVNLILNSIQATPNGGMVRISTQSLCDSERTWLRFLVCDTGPGIPETDLSRVFDPFFTTRPDGTGLGLSIVQHIVQNHRGKVTVSNAAEGGACVIMDLPLHQRKEAL
ncbi:MAG: hypothetical protein GFH27_549371n23 [Chloroflexi bacterium AL-W]|nr:hypothetical protein [Chloroflexi bacterium AL-N1]NOK70884.1 hypothetical protein [Chloroflexi bacterium AL-N10]NOK78553.1 hypothetical protein [Chloroflexi bacterium AL-N5]NOK85785.1 hypothetical protein [Chloroflexi bacterium AL-W]NOK92701.1 hypothetical protein [Chloroflexi bacterium AL-N15]